MKWIYILILALVLVAPTQAALTDGLFAFYRMDDAAGKAENNTVGNPLFALNPTGTLGSGVGVINNSRNGFTYNTNYFRINDTNTFDGNTNATFNFWVNLSSGTAQCALITKWKDPSADSYSILANNQQLRVLRSSSGAYDSSQDLFTGASNKLTYNTWMMVTVKFGQNAMAIYFNGTQVATNTNGFPSIFNSTTAVSIGPNPDEGSNTCTANTINLDLISFYNRSLTNAEITELYNNGAGVDPTASPIIAGAFKTTTAVYDRTLVNYSLFVYNATVTNHTQTQDQNITTLFSVNASYLINATFSQYDSYTYLNKTIIDINTSGTGIYTFNYSSINVSVINQTGSYIYPYTVSVYANETKNRVITYNVTSGTFSLLTANVLYVNVTAENYSVLYTNISPVIGYSSIFLMLANPPQGTLLDWGVCPLRNTQDLEFFKVFGIILSAVWLLAVVARPRVQPLGFFIGFMACMAGFGLFFMSFGFFNCNVIYGLIAFSIGLFAWLVGIVRMFI